jgi:hypothetical protein
VKVLERPVNCENGWESCSPLFKRAPGFVGKNPSFSLARTSPRPMPSPFKGPARNSRPPALAFAGKNCGGPAWPSGWNARTPKGLSITSNRWATSLWDVITLPPACAEVGEPTLTPRYSSKVAITVARPAEGAAALGTTQWSSSRSKGRETRRNSRSRKPKPSAFSSRRLAWLRRLDLSERREGGWRSAGRPIRSKARAR